MKAGLLVPAHIISGYWRYGRLDYLKGVRL